MLDKLKKKASAVAKKEISKKVKSYIPLLIIGMGIVVLLYSVGSGVSCVRPTTVNNYTIYNGPVYSHE